jgi:hypothetical protein
MPILFRPETRAPSGTGLFPALVAGFENRGGLI